MLEYSYIAVIYNPNSTGNSKEMGELLRDRLLKQSKSIKLI